MSGTFNEDRFKAQVDKALRAVQRILDVTRNPRYAEDEDHTYDDKFGLTEFLTNAAFAAQINVLSRMGLNEKKLQRLVDMVQKDRKSVTLRFVSEETCSFLKENVVDVESQRQKTTQVSETSSSLFGGTTTKEYTYNQKVITKVKENHWIVQVRYKIFCFAGSKPDHDPVVLQSRVSSMVLVTSGGRMEPLPAKKTHRPIDVSLTWLLENIQGQHCKFKIDRTAADCRTPRRNPEVSLTARYLQALNGWSRQCVDFFVREIERDVLGKHRPTRRHAQAPHGALIEIQATQVFVPVLPLMEAKAADKETPDVPPSSMVKVSETERREGSPLLDIADTNLFLNEQCRTLDIEIASLHKTFPDSDDEKNVVSVAEASLVMLWWHLPAICDNWKNSVDYIENMLRKQLCAAIGKEVQPNDFDQFMTFHNQKILGQAYAPKPFCYAIKRPGHYPVGVLSIEKDADSQLEPVETLVRTIPGDNAPPVAMPINAATTVHMTGPRYLHGWVGHRFRTSPRREVRLAARARQFSAFVLVIGNLAGPHSFKPKEAIIVQNKDEVLIPLLLNDLPTAKQFNNAISSLSPEQQRFAKTYRGMQLESSVVGVCVVQLKPQLEVLLGLPDDSLTKEIRLTKDLMSMFLEYQIPSDLLSYSGPQDASVKDKLDSVKEHVKAVMNVIEETKLQQLEEEAKKAAMAMTLKVGAAEESMALAVDGAAMPEDQPEQSEEEDDSEGVTEFFASLDMVEKKEDSSAMEESRAEPPSEQKEASVDGGLSVFAGQVEAGGTDFTALPKRLNKVFEKHDDADALSTTTIKTGSEWIRKRQKNLLTKFEEERLSPNIQRSERNKAFDLLDALSRSGTLPVASAELHVILAVTHTFEDTVMGTLVERNENPIEKVEKSTLLVASTVHNVEIPVLVEGCQSSARLKEKYQALELCDSTE